MKAFAETREGVRLVHCLNLCRSRQAALLRCKPSRKAGVYRLDRCPLKSARRRRLLKITAILLSCDAAGFVTDALRSLLQQDYPGEVEVIVSDDASTDGSDRLLEQALAAYEGPWSWRLMRQPSRSGSKSAHLNRLRGLVTGDLVATFDADDESHPGRLRRLAEAFARDDSIMAVYSGFDLMDESGRAQGRARFASLPNGADGLQWFARVDAYAPGTTLAVRREVLERFPPLEPGFNEDIVLPFRAALLGEVRFIDDSLVRARRRPGSMTADYHQLESMAAYRARMLHGVARAEAQLRSRLADIEIARSVGARPEWVLDAAMGEAKRSLEYVRLSGGLFSQRFDERLAAFFKLWNAPGFRPDRALNLALVLVPGIYLAWKRRRLRRR
ncbi:MAG: glycosyltransferase [Steroidobacteraceae bacterium]